MELFEITLRTKAAVRQWAELSDEVPIVLADKLSKFQKGDLDTLRVRMNGQFKGEPNFPFKSPEWDALTLKTVEDVRDAAKKRMAQQ